MKHRKLMVLLGFSFFSSFALATELTRVKTDSSTIDFIYKQMGVPMVGQLKSFDAQLNFDPDKLASATVALDMQLTSLDAGSQEANDEIAKPVWFAIQTFPKAQFVSAVINALGGNRYEVRGNLNIKGKTKEIVVNFTYSPQQHGAVFDGTVTLERADFAIGEGVWGDFGIIANPIQINFHLLADAGK